MRETGRYGVEAYLKRTVAAAGGDTRKFVSPGRPGVPDQIVIWTIRVPQHKPLSNIHFVETKAPGGEPEPHQAREHKRLRDRGCSVFVLDTKAKINAYVRRHRQ